MADEEEAQALASKLRSNDWMEYENMGSSNSLGGFDFDSAVEAAIEGEQNAGDEAAGGEEVQQKELDEGEGDEIAYNEQSYSYEGAVAVGPPGSPRQVATGAPQTGVTAEIVLVMNSFGGLRRSYFASKRAKHLLDCKGVVYYVVDCNKDFTDASGLKDNELYDKWVAQGKLKKSEREVTVEDNIQIPQVLMDGHPIGNEISLQDLEEDGDLDWIYARAACPACLNEKDPSEVTCPTCHLALESIVPEDLVYSGQIQQLYKGQNYGALGEGEVFEHPTFKSSSTAEGVVSNDFTYEDLFGEVPPEE